MEHMMDWMQDDITWCASECENTKCMRHRYNMRVKNIPHSYSQLRGTEYCTLDEHEEKTDMIDRGQLTRRLKDIIKNGKKVSSEAVMSVVTGMPHSANSEVREAEWSIVKEYEPLLNAYECSKCAETRQQSGRVSKWYTKKSSFCPDCGARMRNGGEKK